MTDINVMRDFVRKLSDSDRWERRVNVMPDAQIIAIYFREQRKAGEAAKQAKKRKQQEPDTLF